jgi:hypothetical protein
VPNASKTVAAAFACAKYISGVSGSPLDGAPRFGKRVAMAVDTDGGLRFGGGGGVGIFGIGETAFEKLPGGTDLAGGNVTFGFEDINFALERPNIELYAV